MLNIVVRQVEKPIDTRECLSTPLAWKRTSTGPWVLLKDVGATLLKAILIRQAGMKQRMPQGEGLAREMNKRSGDDMRVGAGRRAKRVKGSCGG